LATHQETLAFGIFDWVDDNKRGLADLYDQRLRLVGYADRAGFFGYHIAEHHGTPLGLAPSPALFLAAAAQRTRTIRLGPLVYLLPLYNPVRLIEEICMLDHLTHGRLELGIGRGISPFELGVYNVESAESREIFREALQIIIAGLSTGKISHQGRYFSFNDVQVRQFELHLPQV
jgi:alkanesulfonate monooxygenase SsuD/methylene tetrahydromethanopterin reductase-like flavin-dependent oxidoreductase (luciferase family)